MQRNASARVGVAFIDAFPLYRAGVSHALRRCPQIELLAEGASAMDAIQIANKQPIDIMMLDIEIPGGGQQALTTIARTWPAIKLVVLTASEREADVANAMRAGARGYILKQITETELTSAIESIAMGEVYLTPSLGASLFARPIAPARPAIALPRVGDLTQRETQILGQVSVGATNKEIARSLNITEKTVKYYMTSIMQKLQVRNRVEAVVVLRDQHRTPM